MNNHSTFVVMSHVEIYTDGGCESNPGPGGYGVVYLLCPKCQTTYTVEEAKRIVEQAPSLFQ